MTKKQFLGKSAILVLLASIIPLIDANKSQTQTLAAEKSQILLLNENPIRSRHLNTSSQGFNPQLLPIALRKNSAPVIIAQISLGATITIITIVLLIVILIAVIILVALKAKLFIFIGNDKIGIVNKKFAFKSSLRLPPGRIIALNGEPGIQAKPLYPGIHWGYASSMYTIIEVVVVKIGLEEIGLVEAKDGNPLKPGQAFGEVVECENFQNIKAFFDNGGQRGKQRAILNTGVYRINTEMFRVRKVPVTKIEVHEIGLVEAKDGVPLKSGNKFGIRVNCQYFQDPQAFFKQGGNAGKQIDILPPNTYQINTDLFQVRKVLITKIGVEEIGLVEANDGASLQAGQSFGKAIDCDDFQDGSEFIRKGGQKGKQCAILRAGNYRINTDLFTIRKVAITEINPDEIGLVEATDGKPLPQGESFAKIVKCNCFEDAQAFFDHGGEAGKQLTILRAGKYYINTDIFKIRKISVIEILPGEIGLVEAKYGEPLSSGKNFAKIVQCNNFQDAKAFFDNGGEAGKQLAILKPGKYHINTQIFNVHKTPVIRIPQGEIGLVVANDGASISPEQKLGRIVQCGNFQNPEAFLQNGGQQGKQIAILTAGDYQINTELFTVITTANAQKYSENPEKLKVYTIQSNMIGIVTTKVGKTLPDGEIAGSKIEGHDNYQDGQKFIDLGGYKGLQEEVLLEGEWNLNPWFVQVEQVPVTKIDQEEVGVVISSVGKQYHKDNTKQSISPDREHIEFSYQLVEPGYKGVEKIPLTAGHYAINTRVKTVKLVPTTQITLNWSDEDNNPFDAKLKTLELTSKDAYRFKVQFTQTIRIVPENAPKMICLIGTELSPKEPTSSNQNSLTDSSIERVKKYGAINNLVTNVSKMVSGHFQDSAGEITAIEFQYTRSEREKKAKEYINKALKQIGVQGIESNIRDIDIPEDLNNFNKDAEKNRLEYNLLKQQQLTEKERQKLAQEENKTKAQKQISEAQTNLQIAQIDGQARLERENAKAEAEERHLVTLRKQKDIEIFVNEENSQIQINAFIQRVKALSPELYAHIESQEKWAEAFGNMKITYPQIMMGGGNSSGEPSSNLFQLLQLEHLDALRNRLNVETTIQQIPTKEPMGVFSASDKQKILPTTSEARIPLIILLDTSSNISDEYINKLIEGIATFQQELMQNNIASHSVEVAMITFGESAQIVQDFNTIESISPPQLVASGANVMGEGIELALSKLESRKATYKNNNIQGHPGWMFLIAGSTPNHSWQNTAWHTINQAVTNRELNLFVIGIQGVDMDILGQIAPSNTPPQMLDGWKFKQLFQWLADSLKRVSSSKVGSNINLPPITEWARIDGIYRQ